MAIDDILQALDEQGEADCQACLEEARAHADHIIAEAQREAADIRERHEQQIARAAGAVGSRTVNAARLEAKMKLSSVKGDGLEGVFSDAASRLKTIRDSSSYPDLFARLGHEALENVKGEAVVHVAPADAQLAERLLAAEGVQGTVAADLDTAGGLVVELDGGDVMLRNTLEDRLDRARELVQSQAAAVLFE